MEPKFQTSFIPKKPVDSSPKSYLYKPSSGIFSTLSTTAFVLVIFLCVGLFVYKMILQKQIVSAEKDIASAREVFQENTMREILKYNNQMESANQILSKHIVIYPLFAQLEENTVRNVSFNNFKYKKEENGIKIESGVVSKSYNALAQQSEKFRSNSFMVDPVFSNFELNEDGNISANFSSGIDSSLFSYKRVVESVEVNQN